MRHKPREQRTRSSHNQWTHVSGARWTKNETLAPEVAATAMENLFQINVLHKLIRDNLVGIFDFVYAHPADNLAELK